MQAFPSLLALRVSPMPCLPFCLPNCFQVLDGRKGGKLPGAVTADTQHILALSDRRKVVWTLPGFCGF